MGWYHSHPTFATQPSLRDCENQSNYQRLFALSDSEEKTRVPFVGAIVGPYRGADPVAEMTWFHVDADAGDTWLLRDAGLGGQPRAVRVDSFVDSNPDGGDVFERLRGDAFALAEVFGRGAERFDRVDLDKPWGSIDVRDPMSGEPATRLSKMLRSLRSRVRDAATAEATEAFIGRRRGTHATRVARRGELSAFANSFFF